MIIYFTGTGNSRYIAECMAKRLGDTVTDAAKLIKSQEHPEFTSDKPYVFVSPVYAWRLPRVFENWISKCSFGGNPKAYFVINCGSEIGAAGNYVRKFAAKKGFEYMGTAEVVMPENYIVMFSAPPAEKDETIINWATRRVVRLCAQIAVCEPFEKIKNTLVGHLCSDIVNPLFYTFYIGAKKFYATDACISCGKCVDSCMLNNVTLKNGKPLWGNDCTHCMACICKCPAEAIEYGKHTVGLRRYVCTKGDNDGRL